MPNEALGLIEVTGFLGAVVAADTCLKAANVELIQCEVIKGGLTTVELTGDVGAINAAIEAGKAATESLGCLVSSHVIARMSEETKSLFVPTEQEKEEEVIQEIREVTTITDSTEQKLREMKVIDLRKLAYTLANVPIPKSKIKYANKEKLVHALKDIYGRSEN
ncbi:Major carboxysome shell protein 1A [Listeria ivanovii subsp. londoniensis]|uniref:BMC domain-containing protein n=2 Tax=Listeria ivanovii TaxID=1638 RepID=A0ABS1G141_LISIV|nr:BMC domain-containing protein [Listeria ivanovii]AIS59569.1 ethanolamine utilization protein [Listeria ivanovii subsp. londoniensis]MBK1960559.1 BMC domain-containing protein [Listeria ivanovii subsp. londoniensis]MBM5719377.1 BMC domain-containing protein [Listeria ivanovii]SDW20687.1 Carboxysome shell and ethanolamine utilization microcompartment protein CcmL/EutN [Listeria ivanovii]VEH45790.1 Major carboxysome shell protein 1A [Listeria ivanovii subsp. londoniensis]